MASLKFTAQIRKDSKNFAKIYLNSSLREYVVKFVIGGVKKVDSHYFTNNLDDAISTAEYTLGVK